MGQTGSRTRQLLPYAIATLLAVVLVVVSVNRSEPSAAAQELLDGKQLKIMAPADPGGGWDSTAREMQASLQELVGRTEVYNVGGAGGTIGLSNFRNLEGQPNQLMVMGLVMVGAIAANESVGDPRRGHPDRRAGQRGAADRRTRATPTSRRSTTWSRPSSEDVDKVAWAGGSAGGAEQILAGLIAKDLELDAARRQLHRPRRRRRGDRDAAVAPGRPSGLSGVSEFLPQIEAGKLRAIAVAGTEPVDPLPDVPTLQESGIDVELTNWRGVVAPPGITDEAARRRSSDLIADMTRSAAWEETLSARAGRPWCKSGDEFYDVPRRRDRARQRRRRRPRDREGGVMA